MDREAKQAPEEGRQAGHLEHEENRLWRWALWLLVLLAVAVAVLSWERLQNLPYNFGAVPLGLLVLMVLFAAYAYGRKREVSELKTLLRGLQERVGTVPSEEQLDQLSQVHGEVLAALQTERQDDALRLIEYEDLLTRKLQVGKFIRTGRIDREQTA